MPTSTASGSGAEDGRWATQADGSRRNGTEPGFTTTCL